LIGVSAAICDVVNAAKSAVSIALIWDVFSAAIWAVVNFLPEKSSTLESEQYPAQ